MRTHSARPSFICWRDAPALRSIVAAEFLVAARYEPVIRQGALVCGLDLTFVREGEVAVIPFVTVDGTMLIERELEPLVWPRAVAEHLSDEIIDAITAQVLPWIEAQTLASSVRAEMVRTFAGAESVAIFQEARRLGFLGAARYADVVTSVAPYVYSARFANGKRVAVRDADGATGAAILSRSARTIRADLGDAQLNRAAAQWFGCQFYGSIPNDSHDVLIRAEGQAESERAHSICISLDKELSDAPAFSVVKPVPFDIMTSFDPEDGPTIRSFSVSVTTRLAVRDSRISTAPAVGGSSGRILLGARDAWQRTPDADTDDIMELAQRLRAEGFTAEIQPCAAANPSGFDLVHILGPVPPDDMSALLKRAQSLGIPTVVTPMAEDLVREALWGAAMVPVSFKMSGDDVGIDEYLGAVSRRRLVADGKPGFGQEPVAGYTQRLGEVLRAASAVLVSGAAEEAFIRERYSVILTISHAAPYLNDAIAAEPIEALVGTGDFILAYAPLETRCNQMLLMRAALNLRLPLVLAGPVVDADYSMLLHEYADESVVFLPECTPGQFAALYRRARVFVDVSWNGYGLHRIARAGASGCALVVSNAGYAGALYGPGLWEADPASSESIGVAIGDAWAHARESSVKIAQTAGRIAALCDPVLSFRSTISAYAQAQTAPAAS
ncbi:MAG: hypothetical protein M3Y21_10200 [Candidatus Eremiobacteraeota bacterium]|nr:hypothetical protein [Candidatus Eremiobacteraeota bacterium]